MKNHNIPAVPREGDEVQLGSLTWIFKGGNWTVSSIGDFRDDDDDLSLDLDHLFDTLPMSKEQGATQWSPKCDKCGGTNIRKTQTGFNNIENILWCDDCKDEAD